jgi:hypothetical protein
LRPGLLRKRRQRARTTWFFSSLTDCAFASWMTTPPPPWRR